MNSMSMPKQDMIPSIPEVGIWRLSTFGISDVRPWMRRSLPEWLDTNCITPDATALPEAYAKSAKRSIRLRRLSFPCFMSDILHYLSPIRNKANFHAPKVNNSDVAFVIIHNALVA